MAGSAKLPGLSCSYRMRRKQKSASHNSQLCSRLPSFLFLQSVHNFTLPSWATEDTMTKLRELSELSLLSLYGIYKQKEKSRLQGGEWIFYIMRKKC